MAKAIIGPHCSLTSCPFVVEMDNFLKKGSRKVKELTSVLQQDNVYKSFYMNIVEGDLIDAYDLCHGTKSDENSGVSGKHVIIVGAGISGLVAAYELEKIGYETTILEIQDRVGGRIKTIHFDDGLIADAGAMRIPKTQYLTHAYIEKFKIKLYEWINYNPKTYLYLYGRKIRMEDWKENGYAIANEIFPGWDAQLKKLKASQREGIRGVDDYFKYTMEPVVRDLCDHLKKFTKDGWEKWCLKWSSISIDEFLRTDRLQDPRYPAYRPWPPTAVDAFRVCKYPVPMERALDDFLRYTMGSWWAEILQAPVGGMEVLPEAFIKKGADGQTDIDLASKIVYGIKVDCIEEQSRDERSKVVVSGRDVKTGKVVDYEGDAVICTLPLNILRQTDIRVSAFDMKYYKALTNIYYVSMTKVIIQCRTRFWEKDVGVGGASLTSLPIGQLYYLKPNTKTKRGILLCYAWGQDAQVLASQSDEEAIESTLWQISKIHPEIYKEYERGVVKAWHKDSTAQGAHAQTLPFQYLDYKTLHTPAHPLYLAGEGVSYSCGWIQGALEAGLTAAYRLYCHDRTE